MGPMDQGSGTVMLGVDLTPHQVVSVAREAARVELDPGARDALARSRSLVEKHVESGRAVYGLTTGFGAPTPRSRPRTSPGSSTTSFAATPPEPAASSRPRWSGP